MEMMGKQIDPLGNPEHAFNYPVNLASLRGNCCLYGGKT
jgi:hypothetical protein